VALSRREEGEERPLPTYDDGEDETVKPLSWLEKPKTQRLPVSLFAPKESLPMSFISDANYVQKIVASVEKDPEDTKGKRVLELGCGTGALTTKLKPRFPEMFGIELDSRALEVLQKEVPGTTVIRSDVLLVNYTKLAEIRGGPLTVVANLPFHVATQALFTLADHAAAIKTAYFVMPKAMGKRICARPMTKDYGLPSVAFQLYSDPTILFDMPSTAFLPRPKVDTCLLRVDFEAAAERRLGLGVNPRDLRNVTKTAFHQRGKMIRGSLRKLLECHTTNIGALPMDYEETRAYQLEPWEYVHLTQQIFGEEEFPRHLYRAWRGEFGRKVKRDA